MDVKGMEDNTIFIQWTLIMPRSIYPPSANQHLLFEVIGIEHYDLGLNWIHIHQPIILGIHSSLVYGLIALVNFSSR